MTKIISRTKCEYKSFTKMWHTSEFLLKKGQEDIKGSNHQFRASLVFTAFTLEAYLNHIGEKVCSCSWKDSERKSPKEKLKLLSKALKINVDYGKEPWQIMNNLFNFRNEIAHGRTTTLDLPEKGLSGDEYIEDQVPKLMQSKWEKYSTKQNALKARESIEKIITTLNKVVAPKEKNPFVHGIQSRSYKFIDK